MQTSKNVSVVPSGHILSKFRVTRFGFIPQHRFKKLRILRIRVFLVATYLLSSRLKAGYFITDNWSNNYFHWFTEAVVRYWRDQDQIRSLPLILPNLFKALPFVRRTLELLKINHVIYIPKYSYFRVDKLLVHDQVDNSKNMDQNIIRQVAAALTSKFEAEGQPTEKIYVSRKLAASRSVANEVELLPILERHGIRVVDCENMSLDDQIKIFLLQYYLMTV